MSKLFEPIRIGAVTVPNRLVKSAMGEALADEHGRPTPDLLQLYRAWARGGTGLLITGMMTIRAGHAFTGHELGLHEDGAVGPLSQLTREVHREGGTIFAQLCHAPPQLPRAACRRLGPVAPSAGLNPNSLLWHRALRDDEIVAIVRDFGRAARRARAAGFDGVQLHAAHGYLLSRFLSPRFNRRRDRWGGDFGRRLTLLRAVYDEVRRNVGRDVPLAVKLNAHDGEPRGLRVDDALEIGRQLEQWGVDAVEVSAGTAEVGLGYYPSRGEVPRDLGEQFLRRQFPLLARAMPALRLIVDHVAPRVALTGEAYFLPEARRFADALGIPVMCVGGVRTLQTAQRIVDRTGVALVSLARPLLCEPDLPAAWRRGERPRARCRSCNRCFTALGVGHPLRCWQPGAER